MIGIAEDELEAAVQVFYVRKGRVVGRKGFILDKVEDLTPGELVDRVLEGLYYEPPPLGVPKQVLVPTEPDDPNLYEAWLSRAARARRCTSGCPQRGDKRALQETVTQNAEGGVHPPPAAAGVRPQQPGQGAQRAAGRASACPRPRCASSATT